MSNEFESKFEIWINSIKCGNFEEFKKYYDKDFLERSSNGKMPIHFACIFGQYEITRQLIDWECNIEALDENQWRPLHHACRENRVQIVKLLIKKQCEIDPINIVCWTPLHYASIYSYSEIVQILIDNNCNIEAKTPSEGTSFNKACRFGHLENVKILLNNNCEIEIYDIDKCTPVHYVCEKGYEEILQLLLDKNCNIEACDKNNWRPIHYACANNKIEIVKMLLKQACNIEARTTENKSPLDIAKEKDNRDLIYILNEELEHMNLVKDLVSSMKLECNNECDHRLCSKSLRLKTFDKGELIGRGGYGKVCKIQSSQTKCKFAVKILKKFPLKDLLKIKKEINCNKEFLNHERIIKIYGACTIENKKLAFFMEFAGGGTIQDQINEKKTIPIVQVIHFSRQILEALEFLHSFQIIHRDVKPSNILLISENNVKLADFDLSRNLIKSDGNLSTNITTFCGTANFMAPEIINGEAYKFPVDIWSLGATIINMITGKAPYEEDEIPQVIIFKIAHYKKLEMPSDQLISDTLKSFIMKMLHPDPLSRPNASRLLKNEIFSRTD